MDNINYDIVVIGAGVAGGTLSLCLAKQGLRTLTVELKAHPRFTIGESTVPTTTLTFRHIGEAFGVPEIAPLMNYCEQKKSTDKITSFPKTHFWFGVHHEREALKPNQEAMFETFSPPLGPDSHVMRADLDAYLVSLFPKYGVSYMCKTTVKEIKTDESTGVDMVLCTRNVEGEEKITNVHAEYAVDCTGHAAFLSRKFGLLQKEPKLKTKTRTIYGHFEYDPAAFDLERIMGGRNPAFRYSRNDRTGHHCFDGGWIWVIPFDNHTVSIGIVLDVDAFPLNPAIPKEEEFQMIVDRYPTIKEHFRYLRLIGDLRRTQRMQLRSNSVLGPRFILTPHASNFVDPLFSTGIMMTARFIARFVPKIKLAFSTKNFDQEFFRPIEANMFRELKHIDALVAGVIATFHNYELFKQYWRFWIESSYRQLTDGAAYSANRAPLFGSHNERFYRELKECYKLVSSPQARENPELVARHVKQIIDANPDSKFSKADFSMNSSEAVCCINDARSSDDIRAFAMPTIKNGCLVLRAILRFLFAYWLSWLLGTRYAKSVQRVYQTRAPGYRFKYNFWSGLFSINRPPYFRGKLALPAEKFMM